MSIECITILQMAEKLCISRSKAYALANRADFPGYRIDKRKVVRVDKLEEWLEKTFGTNAED